jgi:hypothetical protein
MREPVSRAYGVGHPRSIEVNYPSAAVGALSPYGLPTADRTVPDQAIGTGECGIAPTITMTSSVPQND